MTQAEEVTYEPLVTVAPVKYSARQTVRVASKWRDAGAYQAALSAFRAAGGPADAHMSDGFTGASGFVAFDFTWILSPEKVRP